MNKLQRFAQTLAAAAPRLGKRALCLIGLHWSGASGCSCLYNIKVCDVCKRDVLGILIHDRSK